MAPLASRISRGSTRCQPTWPVTFALRRGAVDSRGVLVTATGGPGSSGVAVADRYSRRCGFRDANDELIGRPRSRPGAAPAEKKFRGLRRVPRNLPQEETGPCSATASHCDRTYLRFSG